MHNKYRSKFSIVNMVINSMIFSFVQWRLKSLCIKNKIKRLFDAGNHQPANKCSALEAFFRFKELGYEKLNIGGGKKNLKGFVNIDILIHKGVEREIQADILDLSFIPDASISHIHTNHFVEHLTHFNLQRQFLEYYRILKNDGLLTIRCPNALGVCYGFWFDIVPETSRSEFIESGFPEDEDFYNYLDGWYHKDFYGFLHWIYGNVGSTYNQHFNILTPSKLKSTVENSGFSILKMTEPETANIILVAHKKQI